MSLITQTFLKFTVSIGIMKEATQAIYFKHDERAGVCMLGRMRQTYLHAGKISYIRGEGIAMIFPRMLNHKEGEVAEEVKGVGQREREMGGGFGF